VIEKNNQLKYLQNHLVLRKELHKKRLSGNLKKKRIINLVMNKPTKRIALKVQLNLSISNIKMMLLILM